MPKNRITPALAVAALFPLAAWAQAPSGPGGAAPGPLPATAKAAAAPPAELPPTDAEKQLDEAIAKVKALKSVAADVAQKVDMLDQKFDVKGRYLKAPNRRVYLRLDVTGLPDATGTMLQVCDGQTLWDYQKILDGQSYRRTEVGKVFEKLESPEIEPELRTQIVAQLGFAGPEELLVGLRKAVRFDQKESSTLDGKEVWVFRGNWKSRDGLLPPSQQAMPATMPLPAYVPSLAVLTVGKADGWPYKLVLVGKRPTVLMDTRKLGPDGRPIGARSTIQEVKPTRIELTYSNVQLNPELKIEEFVFQAPPGARVEDSTQALVTMLDQAIQFRAMQKKAEAAKKDGPLLDQALDIPRPGTLPADATPAPAPPTAPVKPGAPR